MTNKEKISNALVVIAGLIGTVILGYAFYNLFLV